MQAEDVLVKDASAEKVLRDVEVEMREGYALVRKVIEERDTPNAIAIRAGIEHFASLPI